MKKLLASAFALALFGLNLFAQDTTRQQTALFEKVYLHTDRELYSAGDTIWFKSYLVSGITHKLEPGYKNIYVQLVSPTGKVVANRLLMSIFGEASGDIALADTVDAGQYTLRAYTKYLENFGEESFFHRKLWVSKPQTPKVVYLPKSVDPSKIDAMFFPAGGNLILNAANLVAFKVVGGDGKGLDVSGTVVDEIGNTVLDFKTSCLGMGKFVFMPQEGKTYFATIDSFPNFKYEFRNILPGGISMGFRDMGVEVLVSLARNIKTEGKQTFWLVASHKGVTLFSQEVSIDGPSQAVKIEKKLFPRGITKLTLFDVNQKVVSERLVFIDLFNLKSVSIKTEKESFLTREQVSLEVSPFLAEGDSMESCLSVAVVNEGYFGDGGPALTIESYLLVDSELKGAIESPASYFYDSDSLTSAEKLDLLMLVQGWRSYYWDEIVEKVPKDTAGWDDAGVSVEGKVKYIFRNKPVIGGKVVLGPYSRNFLFEQTKTDSLGRFAFKRMYLQDSASLIVNAWTPEGRRNAQILPNPGLQFDSLLAVAPIYNTIFKLGTPQKFVEKSFKKLMALDKFDPDAGSILLGEVKVVEKKYSKNEEFYEMVKPFNIDPDRLLTITKDDYNFFFLPDYLDWKYPPWKWDHTLILIDGIRLGSQFAGNITLNMRVDEVYKIEIFSSPIAAAGQGSQDINRVISIYTRWDREGWSPQPWAKTIIRTAGFQQPNAFYSPKYTAENFPSKTPDRRVTLFWSPWVRIENGKAKLDFYTNDNLGSYIALVEGISKNGKILSGAKQFKVTEINPALKK